MEQLSDAKEIREGAQFYQDFALAVLGTSTALGLLTQQPAITGIGYAGAFCLGYLSRNMFDKAEALAKIPE